MNIAVTGGMGSGKSKVSQALHEMLGGTLLSADLICRDLLVAGCKGWLGLKEIAPVDCFQVDGEIDRPILRKAIFSNDSLRARVDDVIHPLVREELHSYCRKSTDSSGPVVVEIPLLFEKGWQGDFDCTLLVFAEEEVCIDRVMQRDKVSRFDAKESIAAQMELGKKIELADLVINNSSAFAKTLQQIEYLVKNRSFEKKAPEGMKNT